MAVKIRLSRCGKRNQPSYRIVVTDVRSPRDSKFIEIIGYYNISKAKEPGLNQERLNYWLKQGAKPTKRVISLVKLLNKKQKGTLP
jgi:small subunit ribosomal protein S16